MLKVVIVEDEERICNMIASFIDWNAMGFEIVGTAQNGILGKEIIKKTMPDVVITDIRMPGCDGIEMIEGLKDDYPDMDIIIISGHKHFEYAHKALRFGIRYYLLKPIIETDLEEILVEIREKHEKKAYQKNRIEDMQEKITRQNDALRRGFIKDICSDNNAFSNMLIHEVNEKYATDFSDTEYCVLVVRCNKRYSNDNSGGENILVNVLPLAERAYSGAVNEILCDINDYGLVIVLNYDIEAKDELLQKHIQFQKSAMQRIEALGVYLMYVGVGTEVSVIQDVNKSFNKAVLAIRNRVFSKKEGFLKFDGELNPNTETMNIVSFEFYSQLIDFVKKHDVANIERWFLQLYSKLGAVTELSLSQLYSICLQSFKYVAELLENTSKNSAGVDKLLSELKMSLLDANSVYNVVQILSEQVLSMAKQYFNTEDSGYSQHIRKAISYIEENYGKQIKLDDVAKYVYLNPTYFSEIFKTECGVNFSDYLLNIRIEQAKKMLRETNMGIGQIAANVGYADSKYFSKIFTKAVGIKPTGYRKLYV